MSSNNKSNIYIKGTLTIDGSEYEFGVDNDIDCGFNADGYSTLAYNIVADLNRTMNKYYLKEEEE